MRLLVVFLSIIAASNSVISAQVCTAADYADGSCTEPKKSGNDSGDDGEDWDDDEYEEDVQMVECLDKDEKCAEYAELGACEDNPGYMTYHCAVTCNTCDAVVEGHKAAEFIEEGIVSSPCMDDDYRCLEWAGMGECDANNQFGIGQRLPGEKEADAAERKKTEARMEQSIEYMQTVWTDEKFSRVRHKCKNQHEDCTWWAAVGECEANKAYMQTNCAPACETCDLLDIGHRCPIEPGNESIWKPGDLNTLMENIVDNADGSNDYQKYNPKALSRPKLKRDGTPAPGVEIDGPWVVLLENFVTAEEADRLVELGMQQGYERSADVGKEKPDGSHDSLVSDSRTSHNTWCQDTSCFKDPLVVPVVERIANATKTKNENSEYLQLLQYEPGQYYKQHHDYIPHHKDMPCGVRILTLFIYLNDVTEGGGTHFPLLDITVQPKKGNAVLWPSVLDASPESKDGRTEHEALPVLKGIKYGSNAWIHSRNFKKAFQINCH
ncbi:hypothetical protein ACHAXR_003009 [Thalassiosira sp. AJA248-18]